MEIKTDKPDKNLQMFTLGLAIVATALGAYAVLGADNAYQAVPADLANGQPCEESLCRDSVKIRTSKITIREKELRELYVSCEDGEIATGGGFKTEDVPNLFVWKNSPSMNGAAWGVSLSNHGTASSAVTAYAVCVKAK